MDEIRTKDKIFLAVVMPVAIAAAYFYFWRNDVARRVVELSRERNSLVAVEDFSFEKQQAERQLALAREELAAEEKIPMPAAKVKADASDSVAARELAVLEVFRGAGLSVTSSAAAEAKESRAGNVLKATGARPAPVCRTYQIGGRYPDVVTALRTVASREMAVIPEGVAMSKPGHWTLTLWL